MSRRRGPDIAGLGLMRTRLSGIRSTIMRANKHYCKNSLKPQRTNRVANSLVTVRGTRTIRHLTLGRMTAVDDRQTTTRIFPRKAASILRIVDSCL